MFSRTILSWSFASCPATAITAAAKLCQSTLSEIDLNGKLPEKWSTFKRNEFQVDKRDQFQGLIMTEKQSAANPLRILLRSSEEPDRRPANSSLGRRIR
jgi:hypothetical protein